MQPATPNDPLVALAVTPAPGPRVLRLTGTPLLLARLTWAALAGTALTLLVVALPEAFGAHVRGTLGLFPLLSGAVTAAAYLLIGVLVAWRAPRELMALVFSGMLVAVGATTFVPPPAGVATDLLTFAGYALLIVSFFLFPTGRLEPRGSWPLMAFYVLQELLHNFAPHSPLSSHTWPGATGNVVWLSTFIVGFGAQAYRYRRASGPRERQQSRWVLFGFGVLVAGALLFAVLPELIAPGLVDLGKALFALSALALPTSVAVAVTRHRLWDLAPLVNRALLLALLSGLLAAVYVAVVAA
ncbi:hypothetical protein, partial [Deinococcus pimensis]|uniref:hypothetical protein n=1 Tax=Deinococcus pimensis TaxID=309888 RepID=UPI000483CC22